MENAISLSAAEAGKRYVVVELPADRRLRSRLMSLGLIRRSLVVVTHRFGSYAIVQILNSTRIGVNGEAAAGIMVEPR